MRIRGRRVALLLAGALPLLAEESSNEEVQQHHHYAQQQQQQRDEQLPQHDLQQEIVGVAEHGDAFVDVVEGDTDNNAEIVDLDENDDRITRPDDTTSEVGESEIHGVLEEDETDSTMLSSSHIPLHLKEALPFIFDDTCGEANNPDDSLALLFSRELSAIRSLQDEDDSNTCRRRIESLPILKTSPILAFTGQEQAPSCPVRPDPDSESDRTIATSTVSSTLERLESSLQSYIGKLMPSMATFQHQSSDGTDSDKNAQHDDNPDELNASELTIDGVSEGRNDEHDGESSDETDFSEHGETIDDDGSLNDKPSSEAQQDATSSAKEGKENESDDEGGDSEDMTSPDDSGSMKPPASNETQDPAGVVEKAVEDDTISEKDESNHTAVIVSDAEDQQIIETDKDSSKGGHVYDEEEDETLYEHVAVDYASKSAGALIIEKSKDFSGTSNLLNGNKDKYAIAPCSARKKSVVLSLSEDILVKVIKLAHYERFSSTVKDFQVLGSQALGKWTDLGTYQAERGLGEQTFTLTNPTWARYLKFKLRSHHGNEHYCTLSQIKVHGSTMVQGFHEQWEMIDDNEEKNEKVSESAGEEYTESNDESDVSDPNYEGGRKHDTAPILDAFQSSSKLFQMLEGEMQDDAAVSEFYDHIPSALGALPMQSKHFLERSNLGSDSLSSHRITQLSMHPLAISKEHRSCDNVSLGFCNDTGFITVPKMHDMTTQSVQERFGTSVPSRLTHNLSNPLDPLVGDSTGNNLFSPQGNGVAEKEHLDIDVTKASPQDEANDMPDASDIEKKGEPVAIAVEKVDIVVDTELKEPVDEILSKLLEDLPSAECLASLNFTDFKAKVSAARKSSSGGTSQGGGMMEPIFKKLMDEIFSLQTSLSVHDQFTKASAECYQRVLLDMAMEMEKVKTDHEDRLLMLEKKMLEPAALRFLKAVLHQLLLFLLWLRRNLPGWFKVAKNDIAIPFFALVARVSSAVLRSLISYWREHKASFVPFDNASRFNKTLASVIDFVDGVVDRISTASDQGVRDDVDIDAPLSTDYGFFSAWPRYAEGGLWAYPLVPMFALFLAFRMMMCFAPSSRMSKLHYLRSPRSPPTSPASAASSLTPVVQNKNKKTGPPSGEGESNETLQNPNGNAVPPV